MLKRDEFSLKTVLYKITKKDYKTLNNKLHNASIFSDALSIKFKRYT